MLCYCCGKTTMISLLKKGGGELSHKIGYTCTYIHVYIALFSFQFIGKQAKFENIWIITTYHCVRLERHCLFIHFLTCGWGNGWRRGKGVLTRMKLLIFTYFYNRILQIFYLKHKSFCTLLLCCKFPVTMGWGGVGVGVGGVFYTNVFTAAHYKLKIYTTTIYPGQN